MSNTPKQGGKVLPVILALLLVAAVAFGVITNNQKAEWEKKAKDFEAQVVQLKDEAAKAADEAAKAAEEAAAKAAAEADAAAKAAEEAAAKVTEGQVPFTVFQLKVEIDPIIQEFANL